MLPRNYGKKSNRRVCVLNCVEHIGKAGTTVPGETELPGERGRKLFFFFLCRLLYHLNVHIHTFWKIIYFLVIFKDFCLFVMWRIFKVFIEFVTTLLVSGFTLLASKHAGSQFPDQVLNLHPLSWKATS